MMKVRLAAQVISSRVADNLKFCQSQNFEGFENHNATIKFLQRFDRLFDILNSKIHLQKTTSPTESPTSTNGCHSWTKPDSTSHNWKMLLILPMTSSRRKTNSSAIADRRRDAWVTSICKIVKWNFWATLLGGLGETSLEEAWSTSYRW